MHGLWWKRRRMVNGREAYTAVFGTGATVAVAVEACHGGLGEEGEGLAED